jgi:hypothetical protein
MLTGRLVGRGPDHEPLVGQARPLARIGQAALAEAERRYRARFEVGQDSRELPADDPAQVAARSGDFAARLRSRLVITVGRMRGMKALALCWVVGVGVVTSLAVGGCGSAGAAQPVAVATAFYRAVAAADGVAACGLLAAETVRELERSAQAPCRSAILDEQIPVAGDVLVGERFGDQAQVRFGGDTVFLAEFDGVWRVVAVGCRPRGDLPYECGVEG